MEPTKERLELPEYCLGRLAEEWRARYDELADDPRRLVGALRGERHLGLLLVECDTTTGLSRWFDSDGGWTADPDHLSGALGDVAFGAAWTFAGEHVRGYDGPGAEPRDSSPLSSIPATGRRVIVRGFSIVAAERDDDGVERIKVHRHVDWAGVFAQLGLTLNWRVPLPG